MRVDIERRIAQDLHASVGAQDKSSVDVETAVSDVSKRFEERFSLFDARLSQAENGLPSVEQLTQALQDTDQSSVVLTQVEVLRSRLEEERSQRALFEDTFSLRINALSDSLRDRCTTLNSGLQIARDVIDSDGSRCEDLETKFASFQEAMMEQSQRSELHVTQAKKTIDLLEDHCASLNARLDADNGAGQGTQLVATVTNTDQAYGRVQGQVDRLAERIDQIIQRGSGENVGVATEVLSRLSKLEDHFTITDVRLNEAEKGILQQFNKAL